MIAWERKTQAEAEAAGRNPALLDDGDEVTAGTNPRSDYSFLWIGISNGIANTACVLWPSVAGRAYRLEGTTNLMDGAWEDLGQHDATPPANAVDCAAIHAPYYFRLCVQQAPAD